MTEPVKILLVDDDPALRGMVAFALEGEGYAVDEAESQTTAKAAFDHTEYPIVILDMGMPPNEHTTKEGVDVLAWLGIYHPMTLVLVLTGQEAQTTSYEVLKEGAFDFLEKPIAEAELLLAVKRAVLFYQQSQKLRSEEGIQKMQINAPMGGGVKPVRNQAEEKMLRQVLADTNFNVHESARRLGLKRENVYYLIKKYNIERPEYEQ
ncbi:MAG: response regulator [Thiotrichales bacterium]|nr:response regulator [Thiotrichales bacterium]